MGYFKKIEQEQQDAYEQADFEKVRAMEDEANWRVLEEPFLKERKLEMQKERDFIINLKEQIKKILNDRKITYPQSYSQKKGLMHDSRNTLNFRVDYWKRLSKSEVESLNFSASLNVDIVESHIEKVKDTDGGWEDIWEGWSYEVLYELPEL